MVGTTTIIKSSDLRSGDVDSEDSYLIYTMTRDPRIGALYITAKGRQLPVTSRGPVKTFTQADIDNGNYVILGNLYCYMFKMFTLNILFVCGIYAGFLCGFVNIYQWLIGL